MGTRMRRTHIVEYVRTVKFCETRELQAKFFTSYPNAMRVLKGMVDSKELKAVKLDKRNLYMLPETKTPKQIEHVRLISRFYPYLESQGYKVIKYDYEVTLSEGIRADALAVAKSPEGKVEVYVVECERSNTSIPDKIKAYEKYYISKEYRGKFLKGFPTLVLITDNRLCATIIPKVKALGLGYYDI